ncbi:permease [soil metagenome]
MAAFGQSTWEYTRPVSKKPRNHIDDLRGASRLAVDATERVTKVVEEMHTTIAGGPAILGKPLALPMRLVNGIVYGSIRGVTRLVGTTIESALAPLVPLLGENASGTSGRERDDMLAVLNGVLGDYLAEKKKPLAIEMELHLDGQPLDLNALPAVGAKLLVLVHGSSMNELQWTRNGHDHGVALARDLGYTPVYLRYNSGLHISTNGRAFDALLEQLVSAWPSPIDELVILGHSMGGLVARSACHYAEARGATWRAKLTKLVFLGTPHHGAPLERTGNWVGILLGVSRYSAPLARLAKLRSAGVTDLRHGNVQDEHWFGRDRFARGADPRGEIALPLGVACYAIAGTTSPEGDRNVRSDGMVPVSSALGQHDASHLVLAFPESHKWVAHGVSHLDLMSRAEVYAKIREWLR